MKRIWIVTLFPDYFDSFVENGVIGKTLRSERGGDFKLETIDLKECSPKGFKGVDDTPYGGGQGMVIRADVLKESLNQICAKGNYTSIKENLHIVYPSPRGTKWDNKEARKFSSYLQSSNKKDLVFICGRYEGIDERFCELYIDQQISLGDFILTGAEIAVMGILDSSLRFCSDVLGNKESNTCESFEDDLLEEPYYTRPLEFEGLVVPEVLRSGNHALQEKWRVQMRKELTQKHRPDLWGKIDD